jgi:hypothetical protein
MPHSTWKSFHVTSKVSMVPKIVQEWQGSNLDLKMENRQALFAITPLSDRALNFTASHSKHPTRLIVESSFISQEA